MTEHFTNTAVNAVVIGDIIDTTVDKFHWNQSVILFLNGGATAITRDEVFKAMQKKLKKRI